MKKPKKDVRQKAQKQLPDFVEVVDALGVDELEKRLNTLAKQAEEVESAKEADEALEEAKQAVSELGAPYRDAKKDIRLKTRYIIQLIGEKGGDTEKTV
jgi:hypothetical protein